MSKKVFIFLLIVIFVCIMPYSVNAQDVQNSLNVIKMEAETTYLDNSTGFLDNKITSFDSNLGTVNLELTLNNSTFREDQDTVHYENTEIFIILPETNSIETKTTYANYIETFANKVFEANSNTKIGIIGMNGTINDSDENNIATDNNEGSIPGSMDDAQIITMPTTNVTDLVNGITNMNPENWSYFYNLQVAIRIARNNFSDNVNKILISLYDDVPRIVIGQQAQTEYGGFTGLTASEAVDQLLTRVVNDTKEEILNLPDENISFILLRPDNTSYDQIWSNPETGEIILELDGSPYVNDLYGTIDNPTYGTMYSLNNDNLEQIVTDYIYNDVMDEIGTSISNVSIEFTFSQDILDNFDITIGNSSDMNIDNLSTDGIMVWNVGSLEANESATLQYSLQIKHMDDSSLLDRTIPIAEQVVLTYNDASAQEHTVTSTDSPSIRLVNDEAIEISDSENNDVNNNDNINNNNTNNSVDNTVAPGILPQAGISHIILVIIALAVIVMIVLVKKNIEYKDIK